MLDFSYSWDTKIHFGKEHIKNINNYIVENEGSRILIVHDSGEYLEQDLLLPLIRKKLQINNLHYIEMGGIVPNPTLKRIQEIAREAKAFKPDFVLAIGGGSVIDSAKVIAAELIEEHSTNDYLNNTIEIKKSLPIGVVLTIASAGSEVSRGAIINLDNKRKRVIESDYFLPKFAVLNPAFTTSLPKYHTAAGGCDIIFHSLERYFSPTENSLLTDKMSEGLIKAVMKSLISTIEQPRSYDNRATLMWAGTISHNGILGTGKEEDWGVHMIAHELSGHYKVIHGASICSIWGSWARHVAKKQPKRFVDFAVNVMGCDINNFDLKQTIEEGIVRFENFMSNVGMPITLAEIDLDLSDEEIDKIATSALENSDYIGNFVRLYYEDITNILKNAL